MILTRRSWQARPSKVRVKSESDRYFAAFKYADALLVDRDAVLQLNQKASRLHDAFRESYKAVSAELRDAEIEEAILKELRESIRVSLATSSLRPALTVRKNQTQRRALQEKIASNSNTSS